jgi:hypothetical protein
MSQRPHERAAELHNLAAHADAAAAVAHGKEDHSLLMSSANRRTNIQ